MPFPPCQIELSKLISGYYFKIQIHLSEVHIKRLVVSVQFDILIGLLVYFFFWKTSSIRQTSFLNYSYIFKLIRGRNLSWWNKVGLRKCIMREVLKEFCKDWMRKLHLSNYPFLRFPIHFSARGNGYPH